MITRAAHVYASTSLFAPPRGRHMHPGQLVRDKPIQSSMVSSAVRGTAVDIIDWAAGARPCPDPMTNGSRTAKAVGCGHCKDSLPCYRATSVSRSSSVRTKLNACSHSWKIWPHSFGNDTRAAPLLSTLCHYSCALQLRPKFQGKRTEAEAPSGEHATLNKHTW